MVWPFERPSRMIGALLIALLSFPGVALASVESSVDANAQRGTGSSSGRGVAAGAVCRDARAEFEQMQADTARLNEWNDAINGLFAGTLPSDVSLESLFGADLGSSTDPRTNAGAMGEPDRWPETTPCDALLATYTATHKDLRWLRQQISRQQQRLWSGIPADLREELRLIWSSRQRLTLEFERLQPLLVGHDDEVSRDTLAAVREIHGRLQRIRVSMLKLTPELEQGVTAENARAFFDLWQFGVNARGSALMPDDTALEALPVETRQGLQRYRIAARLDALELRSALNIVRAQLWSAPEGVYRDTARSAAGGQWQLLLIELRALRNRLDRITSEVDQDYQEDATAQGVFMRIALASVKTLIGLLAVLALAFIARAMSAPALQLHARLSQHARGNRLLVQLSRLSAGLPAMAPWIVGWLGLNVLGWFFYRYEFVFLVPAVPIARLYILYGVGTLIGEWLVLRIAQQAGSYLGTEQSALLGSRAHRAAAIVMIPWLLGDLVDVAIGSSQLLDVCLDIRNFAIYVALGVLLRTREKDLVVALQSVLPPIIDPWVERALRGPLFRVVAPLFVPVLLSAFVVQFVHRAMLDSDWYRKLYARGFRMHAQTGRRSEGTEDEEPDLRLSDYSRWFEPESVNDAPLLDTGLMRALVDCFSPWLADRTEENTLVLTGERGSGKSAAIAGLGREIARSHPGIRIAQVEVPARTISPEAVQSLIGNVLETDISEGPAALVKTDAERQPTIVILNDAHNFFLRQVGGLDGWQTLLGLTNARLANVFWLIVINNQSLAYLGNVFRRDYQFSRILRVKPWSLTEIRSLVLSRHQSSRLRLRYDDVLLASRGPEAGNVRNAEQRYFSLLWDTCRGNPLLALRLWMSSVRMDGANLVVGVPMQPSMIPLENLPDDFHFVYAALMIHENMTADELVSVTSMGGGLIRGALKAAQDAGFVERAAAGRYRIQPLWYFGVRNLLARKNMLHE